MIQENNLVFLLFLKNSLAFFSMICERTEEKKTSNNKNYTNVDKFHKMRQRTLDKQRLNQDFHVFTQHSIQFENHLHRI